VDNAARRRLEVREVAAQHGERGARLLSRRSAGRDDGAAPTL
jgi:hypothetical protein